MTHLRLVVALLLLGLLAAPAGASPWEEQDFLEQELAKACVEVQKACGVAYPKLPTLKISTAEDVQAIIEAEWAPMLESLGEYETAGLERMLAVTVRGLLAKYAVETNTVHVLPENVTRLAKLLDIPELLEPDTVRVVLIHEAVHALDFQVYPNLAEGLRTRTGAEARQSLSAVVEGHAQLITEHVANALGMEEAFALYTRSIMAEPPGLEGAAALVVRLTAAQTAFAYVQGLAFFQAVEQAAGREGMERALKQPPTGTREIEQPERWLDPDVAEGEIDLVAALARVEKTLQEAGISAAVQRLLASQLDVQFALLPEEERVAAKALYDDGYVLSGGDPGGAWLVALSLLRLKDEAAGPAWLAVERRLSALKDEQFSSGPVRITKSEIRPIEGRPGVSGFEMEKTVAVPQGVQEVRTYEYLVSRHVVGVTLVAAPAEVCEVLRQAGDALVASLVAALEPVGAR